MQISIQSGLGTVKKYYPDIILNRFDLRYKENNYWMHISTQSKQYEVGFHIDNKQCLLGILNVNLEQEIFKQMILYLFEKYPMIERISFQTMICNPEELGLHVKCRKHKFWSLKLPKSFDEMMERESVKFLRKMRYEIKYFTKEILTYHIDTYLVKDIPIEIMKLFFQWKKSRYPSSYLGYSATDYLYRDRRPVSHAYVLRTQNEPIAVLFTSEQCDIAYLVNTAFDPKYARYSVGRLLYYELLRLLIDKNTEEIYLGTGKYDYKKSFGATAVDCWIGDFFRG